MFDKINWYEIEFEEFVQAHYTHYTLNTHSHALYTKYTHTYTAHKIYTLHKNCNFIDLS